MLTLLLAVIFGYYGKPSYGRVRKTYGTPATYSRPSYGSYSRPSYSYSRPSYSRPSYSTPSYSRPGYGSYSRPSYSYSKPSYGSYSRPSYSYSKPTPSYAKPSYGKQGYSTPAYGKPVQPQPGQGKVVEMHLKDSVPLEHCHKDSTTCNVQDNIYTCVDGGTTYNMHLPPGFFCQIDESGNAVLVG